MMNSGETEQASVRILVGVRVCYRLPVSVRQESSWSEGL